MTRICFVGAGMLDPYTGTELDLARIQALVDELIEAHGDLIPVALC